MTLLGTHRYNPATDDLERYLTIALTPSDPKQGRAEHVLRMDPYYSKLPGMKQIVSLINRHDEGDATALPRAVLLAGYIVQGMACIEDGISAAFPPKPIAKESKCPDCCYDGKHCPDHCEEGMPF